MVCRTGDQSIVSKATYGSAQLHIEYAVPEMEAVRDGKPNGQVKGNSGVFLHGSYEIQVLDSYNNLNKTYPDGSNGSLYRVPRRSLTCPAAARRVAKLRHHLARARNVRTAS